MSPKGCDEQRAIRRPDAQCGSFRREDVSSMKQESRSLMPSYAKLLSSAELDDLLAFLSRLRGGQ